MFIEEDLRPYLGTLIRVGEVSEIHPERGTARVVFDDDDGVVSYELAVLQRNTFDTKDFHSVNVGEDVLCLFLPNGASDGFIVGSFYAGEIDLPESTENRRTTLFKDGTRITYDMAAHRLTAVIQGTVITADRSDAAVTVPNALSGTCKTATVKASASALVDTPETTVTGNVTVKGALLVKGGITGQGGLAVSGGAGGKAATITGALETTGDVRAGNISLQGHTHTAQGEKAETTAAH